MTAQPLGADGRRSVIAIARLQCARGIELSNYRKMPRSR